MMNKKEAMEILGISEDMAENIKRSYLRMSRENHPDVGGDPDFFKKINEAYVVLSEMAPPEPTRQEILNLNVEVSLEEAVFGVVIETHIRPTVISSRPLLGSGKSSANAQVLTVVEKIPPIALLRFGPVTFSHKQQILNGSPRDINITYSIRSHERYKPHPDRSKALLEVDETIPVTTALYGGTVEVATIYGIRKLLINPATNIGDMYELKDHGELGSLMVRIASMKMPIMHETKNSNAHEKLRIEIEKENEEIKRNSRISGFKSI